MIKKEGKKLDMLTLCTTLLSSTVPTGHKSKFMMYDDAKSWCMMTQNLKQQGHKKRQHFKGSKYKLVPQRNDHSCRATYLNML